MENVELKKNLYVFLGSTVEKRVQVCEQIYNKLLAHESEEHIFVCDAQSLFYDFLEALRNAKLSQWREKLLNKKYILIDGFHYFEEKKGILDDLTYILKHTKATVILTIDKPVCLCRFGEEMLYLLNQGRKATCREGGMTEKRLRDI